MNSRLDQLVTAIRACRLCEEEGIIPCARPVLQVSSSARIGIFGQAPGNLAHHAGKPFSDPSGVRLRDWMGVSEEEFYDPQRVAVIPMAFCFPGYDGKGKNGKGGDLPPPKLCAQTWREALMEKVSPQLEIALLIGSYAQKWHLGGNAERTLTETVRSWRRYVKKSAEQGGPLLLPMPHPSWRNTGWIRKNPWFETDLIPYLRTVVRDHL